MNGRHGVMIQAKGTEEKEDASRKKERAGENVNKGSYTVYHKERGDKKPTVKRASGTKGKEQRKE